MVDIEERQNLVDALLSSSLELAVVATLAALDLWLALPAILAVDIAVSAGVFAAAVGSATGAIAATWASASFRSVVIDRLSRQPRIQSRIQRFMARYGTAGVGLLGPIILGSALSCVGAIALGAEPRRLAIYAAIGSVLWALVLALVLLGMRS